jgi:hypothetical protein
MQRSNCNAGQAEHEERFERRKGLPWLSVKYKRTRRLT